MSLFHDEENGPSEPVEGLPAALPDGERVLWQGRPRALGLMVHALHVRFAIGYFLVTTLWRLGVMASNGAPAPELASVVGVSTATCLAACAILYALAWAMARAAIFTVTDARVIIRHGAAIRKYVNLPFSSIVSADVRSYGRGHGDIALKTDTRATIGYIHLWPFARPLKFVRPVAMLRALDDVAHVAGILKTVAEGNAQALPEAAPRANPAASRPATTPRPVAMPAGHGAT